MRLIITFAMTYCCTCPSRVLQKTVKMQEADAWWVPSQDAMEHAGDPTSATLARYLVRLTGSQLLPRLSCRWRVQGCMTSHGGTLKVGVIFVMRAEGAGCGGYQGAGC